VKLLRLDKLLSKLLIMPKHQISLEYALQPQNHLMTPDPRIMIAHQPTLRTTGIVVFLDMVLMCCEDERAVFGEIDLHDAEAWRVARGVVEGDALAKVVVWIGEGLPI